MLKLIKGDISYVYFKYFYDVEKVKKFKIKSLKCAHLNKRVKIIWENYRNLKGFKISSKILI